VQFSLFN